jgi:hypothetical protein
MFYAKCAKSAISARRHGYRNPYNFWLRDLIDPIEAIDSYHELCMAGDGNVVSPLFPVGQLDFPSWILQDLPLFWDQVRIVD